MQGVDNVLRVMFDNIRIGQDRHPVTCLAFGRLDSVHGETTRKTGDTAKHGLECLSQVMGNVVFEDCKGVSSSRRHLTATYLES